MTVDEYFEAVRQMGLMKTAISTVFITRDREVFNVPNPHDYKPEGRREIIDALRRKLGRAP